MYHIAVRFDVPAERRTDFIAAALADGRDALASEPGTRRYELVGDAEEPNRFYLYETYESREAFDAHLNGQPCARFFELVNEYATGPTWLVRGHLIQDPVNEPAVTE